MRENTKKNTNAAAGPRGIVKVQVVAKSTSVVVRAPIASDLKITIGADIDTQNITKISFIFLFTLRHLDRQCYLTLIVCVIWESR